VLSGPFAGEDCVIYIALFMTFYLIEKSTLEAIDIITIYISDI
jgi:hypothetical protein